MRKFSKILSAFLSVCVAGTVIAPMTVSNEAVMTAEAAATAYVETLDRGLTAVGTGSGMLVSWRFLADDADDTVFKLYRDNTLIYTSNSGDATCYLDGSGSDSSTYKLEAIENDTVISTDTCKHTSSGNYFDLKLDRPGSVYTPNDCSVGDVDGDGEYELFVKWDPSTSKDNSQKGTTDKVYIDCYKLDGTKLWRIDLGINIRAGAHYTQFFVADFDLDGMAEMTCKTADGTIDGQGNVIGDASADYRNSSGYVLSGPEYYTLFDGASGAALDTVDYEPARGTVSKWGDSYGNRVDRFWGCVAYLDGVRPSVVTGRGYYTRMTATAYSVENDKLVKQWAFDTGNSSSTLGYGDGNHNSMPADVDGDGRQEIITGSTCIDDDGTVKWCTNQGHGDAMHVGDFLPDNSGIEIWICHEDSPYGVTLIDGDTGNKLFHVDADGDTGRCCAGNIWSGNDGAEFWANSTTYDGSGNTLSCRRPSINFMSYWDGDLEREALDGYTDSPATIADMGADGKLTTILSTDGYYTCNTTKGTPCLSADIYGDWREELIVRAADGNSVRIYCTTYDTDYRITTLMHDVQYRTQVAAQNVAYNQPPHTSFYLGSEESLPQRPQVNITELNGTPNLPAVSTPATLVEGGVYMIKNLNSGLYLEVESGTAANNTNVQQWGATEAASHNTWRAVSAGDGYYYLYSQVGDKVTYLLDVAGGKADNGTNIAIYSKSSREYAQQFRFYENSDGTFCIATKASDDKSCVAVSGAETSSGANIIQYQRQSGDASQKWELTQVEDTGCTMDTSKTYMFKNVNSGLYMEVANGTAADNTNVQQWGADSASKHNSWTLKEANYGYYYIVSKVGDGNTYYLNISDGNAEILTNNKTTSHYFKFVKNPDGSYNILTRASKDASALEVKDASASSGANVQQWVVNGHACQKWNLEECETEAVTTTVTTAVTTIETTTTITTEVTTTATEKETEAVTTVATEITTAKLTTVATTAETTTETTPVETETEIVGEVILGDVDCDGFVRVNDAVRLNLYLLDAEANPLDAQGVLNADCEPDGSVDMFDSSKLINFIAELLSDL